MSERNELEILKAAEDKIWSNLEQALTEIDKGNYAGNIDRVREDLEALANIKTIMKVIA
jgi:hypothetical protein